MGLKIILKHNLMPPKTLVFLASRAHIGPSVKCQNMQPIIT